MSAAGELVREHRLILSVLRGLEERLTAAERAQSVPVPYLRALVHFSLGFVDHCHHAKEESCLFPCLEQRGMPREAGLLAVILEEHEAGRGLVARIEDALNRYERGETLPHAVLDPCRAYADLLRQHIVKEDDVLFPMGEGLMSADDQAAAVDCFAQREAQLGAGAHEGLEALADQLGATEEGAGA